ncbi:MAG: hypothetical protein U0324_34760 [Polyangiales bacterium]
MPLTGLSPRGARRDGPAVALLLLAACRSAPQAAPPPEATRAPDALVDASDASIDGGSGGDAGVDDAALSSRPEVLLASFDAPAPRPFEAFGAAPAPGGCRGVRALPLGARPVELLRDRVRLRLPARFEYDEPVRYALSDTRRVTLRLPLGRSWMVVEVEDRFRRDEGTLREAADRFSFGRLPARAWTTPPGLRAVAVMPRPGTDDLRGDPGPGTNVFRAWVATPDGSIVTLFFFVLPEATARDPGCAALASSIVEGLSAGSRALDTQATTFSPLSGWRMDVPAGWARGTTGFVDYAHVTFERAAPLIGPTSRMHFTVGTHVAAEESDWPTTAGEIDGVPVTWREVDNGSWRVRETTLAVGGERVVIRYESTDPDGFREVERIVGTLRRVPDDRDAGCAHCATDGG